MKAKELIKFLETYDPEMRVVVDGYKTLSGWNRT